LPWQNGAAELWIGSCRRELLDHIIAWNERHLVRLLREYVSYYHQDRVHDSLGKDTPKGRPAQAADKHHGDFAAAAGRIAPSLRMARSGISDSLAR
jgi:transposase InsO family protein